METQQEYKYNILTKLENLSVKKSKIARAVLPIALEVSKRTFELYLYIRIGDKNNISPGKLQILADYFKCKVDDLLNEKVKKVNYDKLLEERNNELKNGFGL
tara:strand:- start:215 stop:520 length:306 start_codon:yes stop_codon:yes gene_type:complete